MPTMKTTMTTEFSEQIEKVSSASASTERERYILLTKRKGLFAKIYETLQPFYGEGKVDLEAIMYVITGLKEREHIRENIGDLGAFLLGQQGVVKASQEVQGYDIKILTELEENLKEFIRNKFSFNSQLEVECSFV
jgi:uncharacterized protein YydD (DUF2326 family)